MILIERYKLISGSADKTMRIWDLKSGTCIKVLKGHEGSVKCIVPLAGRFCSGSNDRQLLIWKNDGEFVSKIERREEENIQCLLPISGNRLVTGSNSSLLLVYKIDTSKVQILAYHRESVRCLVRISASLFASGSMDGAVVIWQTESLTPIKILNNPEKYRNEDRVYIYNIKYLLPLGEKYLAAAIGNGFRVYDVDTEECIMDCSNAHDAEVNCLISLYDGIRIVSCSADACIRIWGTSQKLNFRRKREKDEEKGKKKGTKVDPILVGEMWAHSDSVNHLLSVTENSFASCSGDASVVLWKDGRVEFELRNLFAASVIQHQNMELGFVSEESEKSTIKTDESASSSTHFYKDPTAFYPEVIIENYKSETNIPAQLQVPLKEEEVSFAVTTSTESTTATAPPTPKPTRVPEYIFDFAEMLRKEKKKTIDDISGELRQLGHSEAIVIAVAQKQAFLAESEKTVDQNS